MPLAGRRGRKDQWGSFSHPRENWCVRQTYEIVQNLAGALAKANFPQLRCQLVILIGGENSRDQLQPFRFVIRVCTHCVVASPGRLRDFLKKKSITLDIICRYICLDEAA